MKNDNTNIKLLSDIEKFEIININDGDQYDYLEDNDIIVDKNGKLQYLIVNLSSGKFSFFNNCKDFLEIPWNCIKKIGSKAIILDASEDEIKRIKL